MSIEKAIEYMNPMSADVVRSFTNNLIAVDIFFRAKVLLGLKNRSNKDVVILAEDMKALSDEFFQAEKTNAIEMLYQEKKWDLLEFDEQENPVAYKEEARDEHDIRNTENTTEFSAAKEMLEERVIFEENHAFKEIPGLLRLEYYAAYALSKASSFEFDQTFKYDFTKREYVKRDQPMDSWEIRRTFLNLLQGMESVCYAERLFELFLDEFAAKKKEKLPLKIEEVDPRVIELLEKQAKEKKVADKREWSTAMNQKRHQDTYDAKKLVLDDWSKEPSKFQSLEKASQYYVDWLEQRNYEFTSRTIRDWIAAHARANNIRLR